MGRTRDILFIRLKDKYKTKEYKDLIEEIPDEYQAMFSILWNEFQNLEDMLNKDNILKMMTILYPPKQKHTENYPPVYSTYREPSFQKMLCEIFFDPYLILKNQIDHEFYLECTIYEIISGDVTVDITVRDTRVCFGYSDINHNDIISSNEYYTKDSEEYLEVKSRRNIVDLEVEEPFVYLP